jgi:hypothetical protein
MLDISSTWAQLKPHLWGCRVGIPEVIVYTCATGNDVIGTGSREPETGNEREIISRVFPGTPLDSRYEQWNCESNQS